MGAFTGPRDWGRLLTAMITPFDQNLEVDYGMARRVAAHLVDEQKNDGLVVAGTTGESPTISDDEKLKMLDTVLDEVGDRASVVFGAGTNDTRHSIELALAAQERGAHGIMAVNPYYNKPGQRGLAAHFSAIAEAIDLPLMIYNIQPRSAINLETDTLMDLAKIDNVCAVKEASGNLGQIGEVARRMPEGFRLYSGDDALTLPIMALGGFGLVSVAAHVAGASFHAIVHGYGSDPATALREHRRIVPVVSALFSAPSPSPVKYALSLRGFDVNRVRLPIVTLDDKEQSVVREALDLYDA